MQEVVYLKNGSIIRGVIIEQIPNESLKIQTADGSVFFCVIADVVKITKELPPRSDSQTEETSQRSDFQPTLRSDFRYDTRDITGYRGFIDFGYTIKAGDYGADRVEIMTSHGYQFNPYLFLGVGTGIHYYTEAEVIAEPLFIDLRATILDNSASPFFGLKTGYSLFYNTDDFYTEDGGFYLAPSFGVRFLTGSGKKAVNLSIGYSAQWAKMAYCDPYSGYWYSSTENIGGFSLKFGIEF